MTRGYYSLIQFCPDMARLEGVNVGALLYCPDIGFLEVRTARAVGRVQRVFGSHRIDYKQFQHVRAGVEGRLRRAAKEFKGVDDLRRFIAREANDLLITDPRPIAVAAPDATINELFAQLVEEKRPPRKRHGVHEVLASAFEKPAFEGLIERDVPVALPALGSSVVVPYGFQNGRFNLIQPAVFPRETGVSLLSLAGRFQLEGELIYQADKKLLVVGEFLEGDRETPARVEALLRAKHTDLYRLDEVPELIDHILKTAKPLPEPDFM